MFVVHIHCISPSSSSSVAAVLRLLRACAAYMSFRFEIEKCSSSLIQSVVEVERCNTQLSFHWHVLCSDRNLRNCCTCIYSFRRV